jgi:hypothetical protein
MVTVTNYAQKKNAEGKKFFSLELTGEVEFAQSTQGRMYATNRKCTMSTTFDEPTCKQLIGKKMPGSIKKIEADPYEYTVPKTGQTITLDFRYEYTPEEDSLGEEALELQQELAF